MSIFPFRNGTSRQTLFASICVGAVLSLSTFLPQAVSPVLAAKPNFQMPFACGQTWVGSTRSDHNPTYSIDLNFYPAEDEVGKRVRATAVGTVLHTGLLAGTNYGKLIIIGHGEGWQTYYAHLSSISVSEGQRVAKGDVIGVIGNTGGSSGTHLHYEQRYNGNDVKIVFNGRQVAYFDSNQSLTSQNC